MANPAPRRFGLRRSTVRAAPADHGAIVVAIGPPEQGYGSRRTPRAACQVVVIPAVPVTWSPAGDVTSTLA